MVDEDWLPALAAHGLPGAPPLPPLPTATADLLHSSGRHKLLGVLAAAVADGAVEASGEERERIGRAHDGVMRESLLLEEALLDVVAVLTAAGVDHRVLKGAALAHLVHPDPAERSFGDNDVLLAPAELDRGVGALLDAGAVRPVPPLSTSFDRRFAKSVTLQWGGATELDVHRTLAPGPYGLLIRVEDLQVDPVEFALAGRPVRTLPPSLHLLHGAIHVALGDVEARLGNVRDLALLAAHPAVEPDAVIERATAWGCAAPVATGLRATQVLGHERTAVERWADTHMPDAQDERWLATYADRDDRFRRQAVASLRVLSWRDRIAFARALLVPGAANRAARGRSRREQVGRLRAD